ncbi:MAG: tetratricopeptide repeat protein [Deltaproteobacteria bacterium]|nr:tetratricopeptide repeat protein [Deltaproteobacteria bacterium]
MAWIALPIGSMCLSLLVGCQQDSMSLVHEAQALLAGSQPEQALVLLHEASAKDPENAEIRFSIAMALVRLGRSAEALTPLRQAAQSEDFGVQAGIVLASTLAEGHKFEEAMAAADDVLARFPDEAAALAIKASAAISLHRGDVAVDVVDHMLALQPDSLAFLHLRAIALSEADQLDETVAILDRLMETETEEDPADPARACAALAKIYIGKGMKDEAAARLGVCKVRFGDTPRFVLALAAMYDELNLRDQAIDVLSEGVEAHPNDGSLRNALGTHLLVADRFEEAEALVSEGLENAADPRRWAALASVRSAAGNLSGAHEAIEQAIGLIDPPAQIHLLMLADLQLQQGLTDDAAITSARLTETLYRNAIEARILLERGEAAKALELFDTVLPHWPQNASLRVYSALAALDVGDSERAKSDLLQATRRTPGDSDAAIWLARMYFAEGSYLNAARFAERQINQRGPTDPAPYVLAVRAYRRADQPEQARRMLTAMATVRDGLFAGESIAEAGRITAAADGPGAALEVLEQRANEAGLDLGDPNAEPVLIEVFQQLASAGRLDEAKRRASALIAEHPDRPNLLMISGRVALLQGNVEEADGLFARALELEPGHPGSLAGQSLVCLEQGDVAGASEAMDRAWQAAHHPEHGYMAARLRLDLDDFEGARDRFLGLLKVHPDNAAAANDLAWFFAERGEQLDRARKLAELAARLAPGAEVLDTLGYVQLKQGEAAAATDTFRQIIDRWPEYSTARYHLALALEASGQGEEARQALEAALETPFPESEQARALLSRLSESGRTEL